MSYPVRIALIAALGGFLFGFETAVISGAEKTVVFSLVLRPPLYQGLKRLFNLYGHLPRSGRDSQWLPALSERYWAR